MSYDVTTGVMTSWAPVLNNQVYALAVSPDGSRLYVGGQFTTVNGVTRSRIAAFDTATGTLVASFAPKVNYIVKSLVATNTTVYAAGQFGTVGGTTRNRLAAFDAATGATLPWDPNADATVQALVMTPDGTKIIVGGAFTTVGGVAGLRPGRPRPGHRRRPALGRRQTVRDAGANAAILSLTTDGTTIYGTGYVFGGGGNLEGAFAADPTDRRDELGRGLPRRHLRRVPRPGRPSTPSATPTTAATSAASRRPTRGPTSGPWRARRRRPGPSAHDPLGYFDWAGTPRPSLMNWFPDLATGTVHRVSQAAWTVAGNSQLRAARRRVPERQRHRPAGPGPLRGVAHRARTRTGRGSAARTGPRPRRPLGSAGPAGVARELGPRRHRP